ncbi:MAG: hypothetical protein J1F32_00145 [Erysipelotrichales bacterium]|nr:hypothetical protein [Erysipelotrichales bacterium]
MKKRNLAISLIALMVGGMTLTSCDPVSKKDGAILTINNGNENAKDIDIDAIFDRYITKSNGITSYYNAICEVVIRASIPVTEEIKTSAERSVNQQKDKAKSNAETNGTRYSDELDAILESNDVENLEELKDKFIYEQLKTKARENYFAENDNENATEESERYKLLKDYINTKVPYHISHMLINVSASDSDAGYKGQISEQEGRNLTAAIKRLARGDSFGSVAQSLSGDTGSAQNFGEGDLVTLDTPYVNEFKLGVYAFDKVYSSKYKNADYDGKEKRDSRIGMSVEANEYYEEHEHLDSIPYDLVMKMDSLVDVTDSNGKKVNDDDANYYPRNVYFNHLFNSHRIGLITASAEEAANLPGFVSPTEENGLKGLVGDDSRYVLCASNSTKPILVVRSGSGDSYQGIFFIVVEKSGLAENSVDLANYYDYKHNADWYNQKIGSTYVGFNEKENTEYNKRKEKIKSAVESYDKLLDTSIFEYYFGEDRFTYNDEIKFGDLTLEEAINLYIKNTRAYNEYSDRNSMEQTWTEFIEKLEYIESNESRRIELRCADAYKDAETSALYAEGGACRAKNKI